MILPEHSKQLYIEVILKREKGKKKKKDMQTHWFIKTG